MPKPSKEPNFPIDVSDEAEFLDRHIARRDAIYMLQKAMFEFLAEQHSTLAGDMADFWRRMRDKHNLPDDDRLSVSHLHYKINLKQ